MKNKPKVIVYSVNINNYDDINLLENIDTSIDYLLYTDNVISDCGSWKKQSVDFLDKKLHLRKQSRYIKINPHIILPQHDISIYVDHSLSPIFEDVHKMLSQIDFDDKTNIMMYRHRERNCIYDEANEVIRLGLDNVGIVSTQMNRYYSIMGFPKNYGLFEAGFIIRRNNQKVNQFNDFWWNEVKKNSGRDQLSQMFASWYCNLDVKPILIGENISSNEFLGKIKTHKKEFRIST